MDIEIEDKENKAGTRTISTVKDKDRRINMMIWGASGSGKTTLASTAPKPILFLQFDPDGTDCLGQNTDGIYVLDFSSENPSCVKQLVSESNPASIDQFVTEKGIKTIVLDSLTTLGEACLRYGVALVPKATLEAPTLQGYGMRNSFTQQVVGSLLRYTSKKGINIILLAHEDVPTKDEVTGSLLQSIMVGGKLQEEIPVRISEVWNLTDKGGKREILTRATFIKKPMKTRMFKSAKGSFVWKYDAENNEGDGIETWYNTWVKAGGDKIDMPT